MYVPAHFEADDVDTLIERLASRHAALLITVDASDSPVAKHLPILWDAKTQTATGHIARANPHHTLTATRALIVLSGPQAYVSPAHYASKAEHGKVVPTWNYETVHLSGAIDWFDDAERVEAVVRALSDRHEAGREEPWGIDDAPRDYVLRMLRAIVGVSVQVDRVDAKRKLSQNKSEADFAGVREGLLDSQEWSEREVGELMAGLPRRSE